MERFNCTREEWEKLFWDGAPRAPDQDPVAKRPLDHYQILGLRKYVVPSPFPLFEYELGRRSDIRESPLLDFIYIGVFPNSTSNF